MCSADYNTHTETHTLHSTYTTRHSRSSPFFSLYLLCRILLPPLSRLKPLRLQHEVENQRKERLRDAKLKLTQLQTKLATAERDRNLALAADLAIPDLERSIFTMTEQMKRDNEKEREDRILTEEVGVENQSAGRDVHRR
jgi:hypothetical protein